MNIIETGIPGLLVIEPKVFEDSRGYFMEVYNQKTFEDAGIHINFVQENLSKSMYGAIRGLHYQRDPYSQAKLAHVLAGKVYDVAVDLRHGSPTYGKWYGVELSAENKLMFLIPQGFAHGLCVLEDNTIFDYHCDNLYHPEAEGGIAYNDPALGIDWHVPADKLIVSPKDAVRPMLKDEDGGFKFEEL